MNNNNNIRPYNCKILFLNYHKYALSTILAIHRSDVMRHLVFCILQLPVFMFGVKQ